MTQINRHGLSRDIPDDVELEIRQRCGFGCVYCGRAVYTYEHIDPEFADAKKHDPNCMVLLCGDCQLRKSKGLLSKETVKEKATHPKCLEAGFSFGPFDLGNGPIEILLGTILARNAQSLIRICGDDVFSILPPTEAGKPFLINAFFCDKNGEPILSIVENVWRSSSDNWDVKVVGQRITIRNAPCSFALILRAEPPHRLVVERMNMTHKGIKIACKEGQEFKIITPNGSMFTAQACESDGWLVGIDADEQGIRVGRGGTMTMASGAVGAVPPSRYSPCPCGSGKWFKRCHRAIKK